MIAIGLCILSFVACFWAGRRSLAQGLVVLFAFGYLYGILRANLLTSFSHFIFDAGLLGLYLSFRWLSPNRSEGSKQVQFWIVLLIVWPALLAFLPIQPPLVTLVGFRGNTYFIPLLLLGSRLKSKDVSQLAVGLAVLDLLAVAFGGVEYFMGVERFFPLSPVTQIMYSSRDVAGGFLRIPSTFTSAHAFGGMMVSTIPFLVGLWTSAQKPSYRLLGLVGVPAALIGMLMSATRQNFVLGCAMVAFVILRTRMSNKQRVLFVLIMVAVAGAALNNARFQRFKSLDDTDYVSERIAGSVNRGFWEILVEYPMGNGLGGGGTSLPYFLQGQVRNPVAMENEYARILAEQGLIGLLLWLAFLAWFLQRRKVAFASGGWSTARRLTWSMTAIGFATAFIGTGILTSIPGTMLLMLGMGWTVVKPEALEGSMAPGTLRWTLAPQGKTQVPALN
jgi:hypothetical protein